MGDKQVILDEAVEALASMRQMTLSAEWRRVPLSPCGECKKLTPSGRDKCQRCERRDGL